MKNNVIAIIIALGFIGGCLIIERGYNYKFRSHHTISVAGSAYYNFTADLIVWSATFERSSMDIKDAYTKIKSDEQQILSYLTAHGISKDEIVFTSIVSSKQFEEAYTDEGKTKGNVFKGYQLKQLVKVESKNIDRVEIVSREITELL